MKSANLAKASMVAFVAWLTACSSPEATLPDADVWSAVVSSLCRPDFSEGVIVSATTAAVRAERSANLKGKDLLWDALRSRSSDTQIIPENLGGCDGIRVVPEGTLDEAFAESDAVPPKWDGFYARFPNAHSILRMSNPGYAPDRNSALVLGSITSCDGFCGFGNYYELHRQDSGWVVTEVFTGWIS